MEDWFIVCSNMLNLMISTKIQNSEYNIFKKNFAKIFTRKTGGIFAPPPPNFKKDFIQKYYLVKCYKNQRQYRIRISTKVPPEIYARVGWGFQDVCGRAVDAPPSDPN